MSKHVVRRGPGPGGNGGGVPSKAGNFSAELFAMRAQRQLDARRIKELERTRDELQARIDQLADSNQTLVKTNKAIRRRQNGGPAC